MEVLILSFFLCNVSRCDASPKYIKNKWMKWLKIHTKHRKQQHEKMYSEAHFKLCKESV